MLAQTLFLIAIVALFATSASAGLAGYARAESARAAHALIVPALEAAIAQYEATVVAPAVAAGVPGDGSAPPPPSPALNGGYTWSAQQYLLAPDAPSLVAASVTVTPTSASVPACFAAGANVDSGPDAAVNVQCSAFVQESRLSITLSADAGPSDGTTVAPIAHGRWTVTLRLFAQPPYAAIAGVIDDAAPGDPHEGDNGGYGNAIGTFGPPPSADTTIHVIEACTPAEGDCSVSMPHPQDAPTTLPWTNGNANPAS